MSRQIQTALSFVILATSIGKSTAFVSPSSRISSTRSVTFYTSTKSNNYHDVEFLHHRTNTNNRLYMSSVGGGGDDNNNNNNNDNSDESNFLGDFLDPKKASQESENLKRARAAKAEDSLPINFGDDGEGEGATSRTTDNTDDLEDDDDEDHDQDDDVDPDLPTKKEKSTIDATSPAGGKLNLINNPDLSKSPYLNVVAKLSPSDLISKFTSTAHPHVQDAVRSTILGLIGTLPQMAFETTTITTGERLASLMFQLQMTGYMFKNAEYRLSLSQSLGMTENNGNSNYLLDGDSDSSSDIHGDNDGDGDEEEDGDSPLISGKIRGKIKVRYGKKNDENTDSDDESNDTNSGSSASSSSSSSPMEVEVDAAAYMAELRNEVAKLREDLTATRKSKEEAIRKDLLLYIRTLPQQELNTLTNTMSNDVLDAMKGLVNVVMGGIGEGQIDRNTVTEQSGEAMAQLCMWQLVVGYNLRELEVREEMKNALSKKSEDVGESADDEDGQGSIDYDEGGFE